MIKLFKTLTAVALLTMAAMPAFAQDKLLGVKSVSCSQAQSSNPVSNCYDNNTSTFWHSPWGSVATSFPVQLIITLDEASHVDYVRYIPRQDGNTNGNWREIEVAYRTQSSGTTYVLDSNVDLGGSSSASDIALGGEKGVDEVTHIRIKVKSGQSNFASAAEIQPYLRDNSKRDAFAAYFQDDLCTQLRDGITSSEGIEDADVKALVDALLTNPQAYKKFRVGEYEAYRTTESLRNELRTSAQYCRYENPTGIYATQGKPIFLIMTGITDYTVKLSVKNWLLDENSSSYALRNGLNVITPTTTGNCFINYYTDDYAVAPNVQAHFVNGQVQGYWDQQTMTNEDWKEIMDMHPSAKDSTIIIVRSEHAQTAYPACVWRANCPTNIDSTMTLYENVQWAERNIMGLDRYGRQCKNRQLFYATNYGFMAAGGEGAFCHIGSLGAITKPDAAQFDFWGVGHEWGHNNQIQPGFKWSGCGETTNNIYASWAQIHFTGTPHNLRLEDERSGVNDYSGMRGGRMQTYFEEGLRKGIAWQLQDGPDYHGATAETKTVQGQDATGKNIGSVTTTSRNYDHFVKLVPFWQLNLWGTLAGKCPDIIPMVIEGIRSTPSSQLSSMTNGQQQINIMRLACDSAQIDLLPFFEKAGMLRPINAYVEDYGAGWNIINEKMIDDLKAYVAEKNYPAYTEELNYINGHNYHIYRDRLPLTVPETLGEGCTISGSMVKVLHSKVQNAVAYETYNSADQLVRITMYGLGSDDAHSFTQVLYPGGEDAAYIVAVGYDGQRQRIFEYTVPQLKKGRFYTLTSNGKGGLLTTENSSVDATGKVTWNIDRVASYSNSKAAQIWYAEDRDGKLYWLNPQSGRYLGGTDNASFSQLYPLADAPYFVASQVNSSNGTWTMAKNGGGQFLNSYSSTNTGYWGGGSSDANNIWKVNEVTSINVTIPNTGYRAMCYPFGLQIPEGYTAYTATDIEQIGETTYVRLGEIEGGVVPSYTPALLYLDGAGATATMTLVDDYAEPKHDTYALLQGVTMKQTGYKSGDFLTLSKGSDGRIGFNTSNATTMTVNYAYIMADKAQGASSLVLLLPGETAVQAVPMNEAQDERVYDLQGRRVATPTHGIYVKGGHKVVIK